MKVLADLHHYDLYHSLQILFEKRLGWELYRPIGMDWYHQNYWAVYPHVNTAKQYLGIDPQTMPLDIRGDPVDKLHGTDPWLNRFTIDIGNGVYRVRDTSHIDRIDHIAITLEAFKSMKFDIILASMPKHLSRFRKLRDTYQPAAKLIFQAGNNWGAIDTENLMTSAKGCVPSKKNANQVFYHQEFNTSAYHPGKCKNPKSIINLQHFSTSVGIMKRLEKFLPDWEFGYHGAGGRDKPIPGVDLPQKLRDTGFVWHVKKEDEGYGYNIHTSFASGKPMIVGKSYQDKWTAGMLYDDDTVIDALTNTPAQIADKLKARADDYDTWSGRVYAKFKEVVDFDAEFEQIKKFLENLK